MTISPTVLAGYEAAKELLSGMDVRIKSPEESTVAFTDAMLPHTVNVTVWMDTVNVTFSGDESMAGHAITVVEYPVSHEDPEFKEKLGEVLVPAVRRYLSRIPVTG